jgi:hypothetical protein
VETIAERQNNLTAGKTMFLHTKNRTTKAVVVGPMPVFHSDADFSPGLEEAGEAAVRAELEARQSVSRREDKLEWLHAKELIRQDVTVKAAMDAADAANKSALWAKWSVVIALAALIIAVVK